MAQRSFDPEDPLSPADSIERLLPLSAPKVERCARPGWASGGDDGPPRDNTPTEVHVTIGRIEVTAVQESPTQRVRPSVEPQPRMTLDAYLASRRRQGR